MYRLTKLIPNRDIIFQQLPTSGSSLLLAELFYEFGSFTLEVLAFLATWFLLDGVIHLILRVQGSKKVDASTT